MFGDLLSSVMSGHGADINAVSPQHIWLDILVSSVVCVSAILHYIFDKLAGGSLCL